MQLTETMTSLFLKIKKLPFRELVQVDMVIVFLCLSGSLHIDINGRTFIAHEGDLPVCLPNEFCVNYPASDDLDAWICITYLYI